ncbi:MAG: nicotinate-nucleotide--dimethylbenzimidazole phosphoribosyltransferase [Solirubrobacteraceae bacterium]|nr:nicotinate-nucleotide--dimethylbenzimidazole phosphoribosyltransferase [Solirubrobacteraceae bacterium]
MTTTVPMTVARPDARAREAARRRQDQLVKPPGSLGRLEELAVWLAGVSGEERPALRPRVVVAAADHGVAAEGVSAYPAEVTGQMLGTVATGRAAVTALAAAVGVPVTVVDAGVRGAPPMDGVQRLGLAPSGNLATEPALSREALRTALDAGRELAAAARRRGENVLVGGELGIGNTTPATALACWLTGRAPAELAGPGTGLDPDGVARKAAVVQRALELHGPAIDGPLEALRRLGGGEIAVLTGLALGAGEHGVGLVCDGVIATAAVAIAAELHPDLRAWLLAGHRSAEPAHTALLDHLGLEPVLDLGMRLGEGSGATAALAILRVAAAAHAGMATFAEAGVSGA